MSTNIVLTSSYLELLASAERLRRAAEDHFRWTPSSLPLTGSPPGEELLFSVRFELTLRSPELICRLY